MAGPSRVPYCPASASRIVEFFRKNPLQTPSKRRSFEIFSEIVRMMDKKEHMKKEGLDKIAVLASKMNRQTVPRYLESPETIRRTGESRKI